jgi:hypothetical protein
MAEPLTLTSDGHATGIRLAGVVLVNRALDRGRTVERSGDVLVQHGVGVVAYRSAPVLRTPPIGEEVRDARNEDDGR